MFFTVKRRRIVDGLPLHARKALARTFHRETDRCLLDEIGKPDRASRAGGDLSGMKIEEEHPDAVRKAGREISVVSAPRGNASRFFYPPFPPSRLPPRNSLRCILTDISDYGCVCVCNSARFSYPERERDGDRGMLTCDLRDNNFTVNNGD